MLCRNGDEPQLKEQKRLPQPRPACWALSGGKSNLGLNLGTYLVPIRSRCKYVVLVVPTCGKKEGLVGLPLSGHPPSPPVALAVSPSYPLTGSGGSCTEYERKLCYGYLVRIYEY